MDEFIIRNKIADIIQERIDNVINSYYSRYRDNIGFLIFYPMIKLESRFRDEDPHHENAIIDRRATGWFIKEIMKLPLNSSLNFTFKEEEYKEYESFYPIIKCMYNDYRTISEIRDMSSIAKSMIVEVESGKYEITTAFVDDSFIKEIAYYDGLDDAENFKLERIKAAAPVEYIVSKYGMDLKNVIRNIDRLKIDIDYELLKLCEDRVEIDISKMGRKLQSPIIRGSTELRKVVGFLFYLCHSTAHSCNYAKILKKFDLRKTYIHVEKDWLINKFEKSCGLNKEILLRYLDYLKFTGEGTIFEFPIIEYNNRYFMIPSSIMLNDWQFSIINGHYCKKIDFIKRDKSISKSIVESIVKKAKKFSNIVITYEKPYNFKDKNGVFQNSDIDVGLYDIHSNKLLIIECKWKDNHYSSAEEDEKYIKIQATFNEIFNDQISKHKEYLEMGKDKINQIFDNNDNITSINSMPDIFYLAVDKRSQLHLNDKHLVSVYILLYMMDQFCDGDSINLTKIFSAINNLKTKISYFHASDIIVYKLSDDITILSDDLLLNY